MTSQDRFEAWAREHLPTLYLTKTEQGTYESAATGNFFAAWSARDGEIAQLKAELAAEIQRRWDGNEISAREHDEEVRGLKAENEALKANSTLISLLPELDDALEDLEIHGQHGDQGYRKLKDWYRKVALACKAIDAAMSKEAK